MDLPMFYNEAEDWSNALLLYDAALKEINTKLEILNNEFKAAHQYNPIEHITSRIKTPQSIAKKLRHNQKELTIENIVKYVNDVAGIRIICSFTSDIYRIADLIAKQNDIKVLKVKDYIMCPKENGYTSYHMIIAIPVYLSDRTIETKVEIQIRTIAMDFWASLEHKIYYKFEGNAPENIRKELKECSEIVAYLDQKMLSLNEEIKNYNRDQMEACQTQIAATYRSVVAESFGTIVEEEDVVVEQQVVVQQEYTNSQDLIESEEPEEENKGKKKNGSKKTVRKRMLFGIRA
jgi:putative GTP pyrophosphokinase